MKSKIDKLSSKDIRAIKFGLIAAVAIMVFWGGSSWFEHWHNVTVSLENSKAQLESIAPSAAKTGLMNIVPVFELPAFEQDQKILFRNKLSEQLKKTGINTNPLQILSKSKSPGSTGYRQLLIKISSQNCKLSQILDFLVSLKENPYFVGVEEFKITKLDPNKPQEFSMDITVSTFIK